MADSATKAVTTSQYVRTLSAPVLLNHQQNYISMLIFYEGDDPRKWFSLKCFLENKDSNRLFWEHDNFYVFIEFFFSTAP